LILTSVETCDFQCRFAHSGGHYPDPDLYRHRGAFGRPEPAQSGDWRTFISGTTGMDVRQDWEFRVTAFDTSTQIYTFNGGGGAIEDWDNNDILVFTFQSAYNRSFDSDVSATIAPGLVSFENTIPYTANVDGLFPSIQVSPGARLSPLPTIFSLPGFR
jgi:hypothetical protein